MILSVSRRTDIPAFYSEWFMNRLREGFVYVRNPINQTKISEILLTPDVVDCIVFWSKNPEPMLEKLKTVEKMGYKYYFQFSLTPYDKTIETGLPHKKQLVESFIKLSERIGKEKVILRYDPIMLNGKYTMTYHMKAFGQLIERLSGHTEQCIISFVDLYAKTKRQMGSLIREIEEKEMLIIAKEFSGIAASHNISLKTCAEKIDLSQFGIEPASCIDREMVESVIGCKLSHKLKRDGQREGCCCVESVDLGAYHTCRNGCLYCYATSSQRSSELNYNNHNPASPILCGEIKAEDKVTERKVKRLRSL